MLDRSDWLFENYFGKGHPVLYCAKGGETVRHEEDEHLSELSGYYGGLVKRAEAVCLAVGNFLSGRDLHKDGYKVREEELYRQAVIATDDFTSYVRHVITKAAGGTTASEAFLNQLLSKED